MPEPQDHVSAIRSSGKSIYHPIERSNLLHWIPRRALEHILNAELVNQSVAGMPLRTRSKHVKRLVCAALGYPAPESFKRTHPRFPGQDLDVYVQKSNNLQIWNESLHPERRYALVHVDSMDRISEVRVVTGNALAKLDTTGTLTRKHQAQCVPGKQTAELISPKDTDRLTTLLAKPPYPTRFAKLPSTDPQANTILPISILMERLKPLLGKVFEDAGDDQERNRGAALHGMVCRALGYPRFHDDGQFPDVRNQLLEVKLQTARTIDLGLVSPQSTDVVQLPKLTQHKLRHCDMRYVIFFARIDDGFATLSEVTLTHIILTTGEKFYSRFPAFKGKVANRKNQIALPADFWSVAK